MQIIWLYNNTGTKLYYKMNWVESKYFEFHNPEGNIKAYSRIPLLVKFSPNEFKIYLVSEMQF